MKTFQAKPQQVEQNCYIVDATDKILGRLATKVATVLRGKNKPTFTPHIDTGDMVVVINADKVRVTGNKLKQKEYRRYSGYHSGLKTVTLEDMMTRSPEQVILHAVNGMLPKGRLGNKLKTKIHVYAGDQHPHAAQKPEVLEV